MLMPQPSNTFNPSLATGTIQGQDTVLVGFSTAWYPDENCMTHHPRAHLVCTTHLHNCWISWIELVALPKQGLGIISAALLLLKQPPGQVGEAGAGVGLQAASV